MKMFWLFMLVEFVAFFLATLNFRYCANGKLLPTLGTDVLLAANGFVVVKLVSEATSPLEMLGYVIGAGLGSLVGMRLTRGLDHGDRTGGSAAREGV